MSIVKQGRKIKWSQISQNNKFNPLQFFKAKILAQKGQFLKRGREKKMVPNKSKDQTSLLQAA